MEVQMLQIIDVSYYAEGRKRRRQKMKKTYTFW